MKYSVKASENLGALRRHLGFIRDMVTSGAWAFFPSDHCHLLTVRFSKPVMEDRTVWLLFFPRPFLSSRFHGTHMLIWKVGGAKEGGGGRFSGSSKVCAIQPPWGSEPGKNNPEWKMNQKANSLSPILLPKPVNNSLGKLDRGPGVQPAICLMLTTRMGKASVRVRLKWEKACRGSRLKPSETFHVLLSV